MNEDERGHCPKCGRFCGQIVGTIRNEGLVKVTGECRAHGEVDLSDQDWGYEDFDGEDPTPNVPVKRAASASPPVDGSQVECPRRTDCTRNDDGIGAHCEPHAHFGDCDFGADGCPPCVPCTANIILTRVREHICRVLPGGKQQQMRGESGKSRPKCWITRGMRGRVRRSD